jgi:exodeoxyribonuclease III
MKLITWNCQGAFRKKADAILIHQPDILVVQECEHPDKLKFSATTLPPTDMLWFGENKHKGLAVFSYGNYRFRLLEEHHNTNIKLILPIAVTGGAVDFTLFAIWAHNPSDPDGRYVEQTWKAIHHYDHLLSNGPAILTGDFNSNTIWDRPRRVGNHTSVVAKLAEKGIHSLYHKHFDQVQGTEQHPTFYLYRNQEKPYHMDYCFASEAFSNNVQRVEVGSYKNWIEHSDHMPVIIHFGIEV